MAFISQKEIKLKNGEVLVVRSPDVADAAAMLKFVNSVAGETDFLTFGENEFNKTEAEEVDAIQKNKKSDNQIFIIAEINGELVGVLNVSADEKSRLKHIGVFGVSVRKTDWSKGIGTALIQTMLTWVKDSKIIRKINLSVIANNESAIKLYEKFGFEKEGLIKRDLCVDGKFYDAYAMGIGVD
jgi:RimJ/RimL family protein N-acetyltransferase